MKDKKYMLCSTWNAPKEVFESVDEISQGQSVDKVLFSTHLAMQFCGLQQIQSFHFHDVFKGEFIVQQINDFQQHIKTHF